MNIFMNVFIIPYEYFHSCDHCLEAILTLKSMQNGLSGAPLISVTHSVSIVEAFPDNMPLPKNDSWGILFPEDADRNILR
jgi:hypothetical protein